MHAGNDRRKLSVFSYHRINTVCLLNLSIQSGAGCVMPTDCP
jgi:hypothetical protein